ITNNGTAAIYTVARPLLAKEASAPVVIAQDGGGVSGAVDFSRITPRQLQKFLDDRLMGGYVDGPDGLYCSTLACAIPRDLEIEQPDVPVDLTATIESMNGFARDHGCSKLGNLYDGR